MISRVRLPLAAAAALAVGLIATAMPSGAVVLAPLTTTPANWIGGSETPYVASAFVSGVPMPSPVIWACATTPCEPNAAGNDHAVFRKTIDLRVDPDATISAHFKIAADDMFIFSVNGRPAFAGMLRADPTTRVPIPYEFWLSSPGEQSEVRLYQTNPDAARLFPHDDFLFAFVRDVNEVRIDAYDGYFLGEKRDGCEANAVAIPMTDGQYWCNVDGLYNWLYVDGAIETVPEPASLAALGVGLALLGGLRARRRRDITG